MSAKVKFKMFSKGDERELLWEFGAKSGSVRFNATRSTTEEAVASVYRELGIATATVEKTESAEETEVEKPKTRTRRTTKTKKTEE